MAPLTVIQSYLCVIYVLIHSVVARAQSQNDVNVVGADLPTDDGTPVPPPGAPIVAPFGNSSTTQDKANYIEDTTSSVSTFENSPDLTTYQINDTETFGGFPSSVPVFVSAAVDINATELVNITAESIDYALPEIFSQLGIPPPRLSSWPCRRSLSQFQRGFDVCTRWIGRTRGE